MSYEAFVPHCAICTRPVNLTESKADEDGQAVHEDCYVSTLVSTKINARAGHDDSFSIQPGRQIPLVVRCSDDLSWAFPTARSVHRGFWY